MDLDIRPILIKYIAENMGRTFQLTPLSKKTEVKINKGYYSKIKGFWYSKINDVKNKEALYWMGEYINTSYIIQRANLQST